MGYTWGMINIETNAADAVRWLQRVQRKQIPFATSIAINKSGARALKRTRADQAKRYKSPRAGVARGIGMEVSHKNQRPHISAVIFSRDHFQALQETGGTKRSGGKDRKGKIGGADHLAVPARGMGKMTDKKRPKALVAQGKAVRIGRAIIRTTKARKRKGSGRDGRKRLFLLVKSARIKIAKPTMRESVEGTIRRVYARTFQVEYQRAIRSPKPRFGR